MKPPAPEAIENALAHLIDSIILENGTNHYLDSECREAVRVDNIIEAFQVTMNALQKKVDHIVSHYKSHRNNVVPFISRLPNEILGRIFSLAVPPRLWSVKKLHQLALVCKSWFRTVKSTPDLWALVLHDMMMLNPTLEHVAIALRLSKSAPLTLLFRNEQKSQNPSSRLVTQDVGLTSHKLTLAADHVNRWRSFTFHGRSTQSVLHALEHPELTLETLEIAWPAEYDSLFPSFSLAYGDRLRHLSLSNVTARCSSFQGLVTLRLNNTSSIHQIAWLPPFSQVVETLEASPHLEVLTLQQTLDPLSGEDPFEILFDQETGSPKPPSSRAIHLPRLQCLVLRNLPYIATHYLLQYIHSDALTRVRIRARNTESPFYLAQSFGFWTDDNPHTAANALDRLPKHHKLGIWHNGNSVFAWATPGSEKSIMDVTQDDIEHSRTPYFEVRFTDSGDEVEGEGPMKDIADVCNLSAITVRPVTLYFSPQAANTPPTDVLAAVQSMPLTLKLLNLWNLPWET
ncbi:hypothetical protein FRB94_010200 [Tulasnella sp. JGI-2019a]|nr:hypothetical protein FRB94_010200 [Tulasnella sp. JGI-2019a]KAG9002075.1 hypothetical protein FRB93_011848 [Tulasnella sp. JGI-2019a]KAG9032034.1 hypothetical protein FRB95_001986 [Tulasnella sp. JGI-2019a]